MKGANEIKEDEIRIIGDSEAIPSHRHRLWILISLGIGVLGLIVFLLYVSGANTTAPQDEPAYFDPQPVVTPPEITPSKHLGKKVSQTVSGFTEMQDTIINDIPLRLYIPHNAEATLHVGRIDRRDTTIIYAAQAADVRADNKKIVGAFVLAGEPLAWGLSKRGYCAIVDGIITIGVADNSPLFEEATGKGGYFFRQYPLVDNGQLVENEPKGKSIRRALCDRGGEIIMVESEVAESFHDFAQALVDMGVTNAIYLVGSTAFGWAVGETGEQIEFGEENGNLPQNTNYIIWRRR